jgi:hypothetical protein
MADNTIKVLTAISKEIDRRFDVKADLLMAMNRQYDKPHTAFGSNSGSSIEIKKPQRLTGTASATLDVQDVVEQTATLNVNNDYHVGLAFTASELTQDLLNPNNLKMFADDYLDSAVDDIIAKIQTDASTFIHQNTYNSVGTPGTGPTSYQVVTQARAKLNNGRAPRSGRNFILSPDDAALLNNAQSGLFHAGDAIASNYKDGALSASNGFSFLETPDITSHTNGSDVTGCAVDGASQSGATLTVDGLSSAPTQGTIFTIADVYSVDPVSGQSTGNLQQFVVGADATTTSIPISPSIATSGAYKTVNAAPANDAAITFVGSASTAYPQGVAMHKDAFVCGTAELRDIGVKYEIPIITGGAGEGYSKGVMGGPQKGIYMKLYMDGDITNRRAVARLDVRYGFAALIPEWATRIQGA